MLFWHIGIKNETNLIIPSRLNRGGIKPKRSDRERDPATEVYLFFLQKEDLERFIDTHQPLTETQEIQSSNLNLEPLPPHPTICYEVAIEWDEDVLNIVPWWLFMKENRIRSSTAKITQLSGT